MSAPFDWKALGARVLNAAVDELHDAILDALGLERSGADATEPEPPSAVVCAVCSRDLRAHADGRPCDQPQRD